MPIQNGSLSTGKVQGQTLKAYLNVVGAVYPTTPSTLKNVNVTFAYTAQATYALTFSPAMKSTNYFVVVESTGQNNPAGTVSARTTTGCTVVLSSNGTAHEFSAQSVTFEIYE